MMELTYRDLLNRMTDMQLLSIPPLSGEKSGCVSSYDRRSRYDEKTDSYIDWDANDDGGGFERALDDGGVIALELNGPGVIWRSWSAMPGNGNIRVFADGEKVIDTPFIRYFTHFGEDYAPRNLPDICPLISRGYNSFVPIPFQNNIRIEFAPDWGRYYHFTYTTFAKDTIMPPYGDLFKRPQLIALAELDRKLHLRGIHTFDEQNRISIEQKGQATLFEATGEGAVEQIQLRLSNPAQAYRLLLKIYWDDENTPAVCAPLCDFFGTSAEMNPFATWASGYVGGVLYCRWVMPFASGARIAIENLGDDVADIAYAVQIGACPDAKTRLRFHAKWHRDGESIHPYPDWPLLQIPQGTGRFCGTHLRILDTFPYPDGMEKGEWWFWYDGSQRVDWWWGEGDEKFFVDKEKFPSTFGTGSEDYVGYAWAADPPLALFDSAFAANSAVPIDGNGITSVCRFHICDNIPFQTAFEAFIEKYKANEWGKKNKCLYAATAFWYQTPGTRDIFPQPTLAQTEELT